MTHGSDLDIKSQIISIYLLIIIYFFNIILEIKN